MKHIQFRPMTQEDIPDILIIDQEAHQFPWSESTLRDCIRVGYDCWVIQHRKGIAGYGIMRMTMDECHILNVCVRPAFQGKGIGRQLMNHLLQLGLGKGAVVSFLEVRASNTPAIHLYERLGYHLIERREGYYPAVDGREDAFIYRLDIPNWRP